MKRNTTYINNIEWKNRFKKLLTDSNMMSEEEKT